MRIARILLATLLAAGLLTGCKSRGPVCKQDNKVYAGAKEVPPLEAPPGLEAPDTRNSLRIPELSTPERLRGKDEPCLDAPPPFTTPKAVEVPKQQ
jgi:uncharacterized lipoprotein